MSQEKESPRKRKSSFFFDLFFYLLLLSPFIIPFFLVEQPVPGEGTSIRSEAYPMGAGQVQLLADQTLFNPDTQQRMVRQEIFDTLLGQIRQADELIVADFFLWNPWTGKEAKAYKQLARPLAMALIKSKRAHPEMPVLVITDPINRVYGDMAPAFFKEMEDAGITLVYTDLDKLPDSNWIYGTNARFYRKFVPGLEEPDSWVNKPRFSNPFEPDGPSISAVQMGRLLFFKANHRKVLVTGSQARGLEVVVSSFNPADGSSAHSNVGVRLQGKVAQAALDSELGVAGWSTQNSTAYQALRKEIETRAQALEHLNPGGAELTAQWLSEGGIRARLLELLKSAKSGDHLDISMFYLSDRDVVKQLKAAVERGAVVRLLLDANRDAFGRTKNGIPNRTVAFEMMRDVKDLSLSIRWADTHGEQFHPKVLALYGEGREEGVLLLGSANWTRRNLDDLNLEAGVCLKGADEALARYREFFELAWQEGSLEYSAWEETGWKAWLKYGVYRVQAWTGLSTF